MRKKKMWKSQRNKDRTGKEIKNYEEEREKKAE